MSQELIVAVFNSVSDADASVWELRKLAGEVAGFRINSGVMAEKDKAGNVTLLGTKTNPYWGIVIGAVTGSLIGLLGGPSGAILGFTIGASAGLAGVALHDILDHEFIEAISRDFPAGAVAIILEATEVSPVAVNEIVATHSGVVHRKSLGQ